MGYNEFVTNSTMDRKNRILCFISKDSYTTYQKIADELQVSKKTVYNDVTSLNDELFSHGAVIVSKAHRGLILEVDDAKKFEAYVSSLQQDSQVEIDNGSRVLQITRRLISSSDPIKMDDLCEELFISRSTLNNDLKKVKAILKEYDLKMISSAYKGSSITGSENNVRRCLSEIRRKLETMEDKTNNKEMEEIASITKDVFADHGFRIPEYLFSNLVIHLYIAMIRIRRGYSLPESEIREDLFKEREYRIAADLTSQIESKLGVKFPEAEVNYTALSLKSREYRDEQNNSVISKEIYLVVMEMLDEIDQMFHYDFKYDLELVSLLASHVASLEVRLLYDMPLDNPLIQEIREGSLLAYEMANVACSKLVEHYGKKVTPDEMAYIALHFHLAIERKKDKHKKNVLIVCGTGRGSAELLAYNIRRNYGNELNVVGTHESSDLSGLDFSRYDYILTTIRIDEKVPIPIIEISMINKAENDRKLSQYLSYNKQSRMLQYFRKDLFLPRLKEKEKEKILQVLCEKAEEKKLAEEGFYSRVMKREEIGQTAFGNGIAIPHPYRPEGKESFVVTGILEEPISWNGEEVKIVFLLSMRKSGDRDLQLFYRSVGKLLSNKAMVDLLFQNQDFETLISILDTLQEE